MGRPQQSKRRKSLAQRSAQKPLTEEQRAEIEAKMCGEKTPFKFKGDAQRRAAELGGLDVYKCQVCGNWHLTSKRPPI